MSIMFLTRRVSGTDLRAEILDLVHGGTTGLLVLVDAVGLQGGHVKILTHGC